MILFRLKADCTFLADGIDDAMVVLALHLLKLTQGEDPSTFNSGSISIIEEVQHVSTK